MDKLRSLSKAEMKKVVGGNPDTPYCMVGSACVAYVFSLDHPDPGTCITEVSGSTVFCGCSSATHLSSNHREGNGCWGAFPPEV